MFDGVMPDTLQKDVDRALFGFGGLYVELLSKDKTAVERRIFMMALHAYEKRFKSDERFMPCSIMALCQYEGYAKKLKRFKTLECFGERVVLAPEIRPEEERMLNKVISIVYEFRKKWKIPAFKILGPGLTGEELDSTADYIEGHLLESKSGLSKKGLDFAIVN